MFIYVWVRMSSAEAVIVAAASDEATDESTAALAASESTMLDCTAELPAIVLRDDHCHSKCIGHATLLNSALIAKKVGYRV